MAREINKLTAKEVAALNEPGLYGDGAGLWLKIDQTQSKRWVPVYFLAKKRREMALGPVAQVDLKTARAKAAAARQLVADGRDPIAERRAAEQSATTFGEVAMRAIATLEDGWRSNKTASQRRSSLKTHAPEIWKMPVSAVTTADVRAALDPIRQSLPETPRGCALGSNTSLMSPG